MSPDPKKLEPPAPALDVMAVDATEGGIGTPLPRRGLWRFKRRVQGEVIEEAPGLTHDGRLKSGKLAGLSMPAAIVTLSWPIVTESLLNSAVGLTDTVLASGLENGRAAADAVGGASYLLWFVGLIGMALGIGTTALVSRSVGAGRLAVANAAVGQTLILGSTLGVVFGGVLFFAAAPASVLFGMDEQARGAFIEYLRIVAFSVPFLTILSCGIASLRGAGDNLSPMLTMIAVNVVNMVGSWTLAGTDLTHTTVRDGERISEVVLANPFEFDLGVAGVATGTVMAEVVGALMVIGFLARGAGGVGLRRRRLRPHWHTMRRLIRLGTPNFLETFGMWVGNFLVILIVGSLGSSGYLGAHIVAIRIEAFSFLPGFAMGGAAATLAGQYLGAGSPSMARRAILVCTAAASIFMGIMGVVLMVFPGPIVAMFTPQAEHLRLVPPLLVVTGTVQVPFAVSIVLRSAMRGAGDGKAAMWIMWICTFLIRLPLAWLLSGGAIRLPEELGGWRLQSPVDLGPGLTFLWVALCLEMVVRAAMFTARFMSGRWSTARV